MNKILITLTILVTISGCSKVVTQKDISQAEEYCSDKDGVFSIEVTSDIVEKHITCRDGAIVSNRSIK